MPGWPCRSHGVPDLLDDALAEPLGGDFGGLAVLLHLGQRGFELAQNFGVFLAQSHALVLGSEVVLEPQVLASLLGHVEAPHDLVDHDGVQAAGRQVHQRGDVVAEGLQVLEAGGHGGVLLDGVHGRAAILRAHDLACQAGLVLDVDRKSTRLNSSHLVISYAVFCLKKKKKNGYTTMLNTPPPRHPTTHRFSYIASPSPPPYT